ncbi:MAG: hypothetical protein U5J99_12760 [Parvularculaceae bacterium]|nr:hypothetical protein [Parvularculaceae bacterium]
MKTALVYAAAFFAAAEFARAEPLGEDLCGFTIEGLTLESTRDDVASVFVKRGWNDVSTPGSRMANGVAVERIMFDRTRKSDEPEEIKADKDGPVGRFQIIREEGGQRSIKLTDYAPTPPAERARALCSSASGRFAVTGCDQRLLSRDAFGVIIRPLNVAPGATYCSVAFDGAKTAYGDTYAVGVVKSVQRGRGQPGRKRGRE